MMTPLLGTLAVQRGRSVKTTTSTAEKAEQTRLTGKLSHSVILARLSSFRRPIDLVALKQS